MNGQGLTIVGSIGVRVVPVFDPNDWRGVPGAAGAQAGAGGAHMPSAIAGSPQAMTPTIQASPGIIPIMQATAQMHAAHQAVQQGQIAAATPPIIPAAAPRKAGAFPIIEITKRGVTKALSEAFLGEIGADVDDVGRMLSNLQNNPYVYEEVSRYDPHTMTTKKTMPGELANFLQGRPHLKKLFTPSTFGKSAGFEDARVEMESLGYDLFNAIDMVHSGQRRGEMAIDLAKHRGSPRMQVLAGIAENLTDRRQTKSEKLLGIEPDPRRQFADIPEHLLSPGAAFEIVGMKGEVGPDRRINAPGTPFHSIPIEGMGSLPVDADTFRAAPAGGSALGQITAEAKQAQAALQAVQQELRQVKMEAQGGLVHRPGMGSEGFGWTGTAAAAGYGPYDLGAEPRMGRDHYGMGARRRMEAEAVRQSRPELAGMDVSAVLRAERQMRDFNNLQAQVAGLTPKELRAAGVDVILGTYQKNVRELGFDPSQFDAQGQFIPPQSQRPTIIPTSSRTALPYSRAQPSAAYQPNALVHQRGVAHGEEAGWQYMGDVPFDEIFDGEVSAPRRAMGTGPREPGGYSGARGTASAGGGGGSGGGGTPPPGGGDFYGGAFGDDPYNRTQRVNARRAGGQNVSYEEFLRAGRSSVGRRGGQTLSDKFFGTPSTTGLMMSVMFGGWESFVAAQSLGTAMATGGSFAAQSEAYLATADTVSQGILGSFASMAAGSFAPSAIGSRNILGQAAAGEALGASSLDFTRGLRASELNRMTAGPGSDVARSLVGITQDAAAMRSGLIENYTKGIREKTEADAKFAFNKTREGYTLAGVREWYASTIFSRMSPSEWFTGAAQRDANDIRYSSTRAEDSAREYGRRQMADATRRATEEANAAVQSSVREVRMQTYRESEAAARGVQYFGLGADREMADFQANRFRGFTTQQRLAMAVQNLSPDDIDAIQRNKFAADANTQQQMLMRNTQNAFDFGQAALAETALSDPLMGGRGAAQISADAATGRMMRDLRSALPRSMVPDSAIGQYGSNVNRRLRYEADAPFNRLDASRRSEIRSLDAANTVDPFDDAMAQIDAEFDIIAAAPGFGEDGTRNLGHARQRRSLQRRNLATAQRRQRDAIARSLDYGDMARDTEQSMYRGESSFAAGSILGAAVSGIEEARALDDQGFGKQAARRRGQAIRDMEMQRDRYLSSFTLQEGSLSTTALGTASKTIDQINDEIAKGKKMVEGAGPTTGGTDRLLGEIKVVMDNLALTVGTFHSAFERFVNGSN